MQFLNHLMIRDICPVDHLNGLVNPRIEGLTQRDNRLHSSFVQRILKLAIDKLDAIAEVAGIATRL